MKKNIGRKGISLCIAVSLLLAGCSSSEEVNRTEEITVSEETQEPVETTTSERTDITAKTTAETNTEQAVTTPVTDNEPVTAGTTQSAPKPKPVVSSTTTKATTTTTAKPVTTTTAVTTTTTTTTTTTAATEPKFVLTEEMRLQYEKEAARLINEFRVENGLKALEWNEIMHQATRIRAEEETIQIGHERPNGEDYVDLLIELGYWSSRKEYTELSHQGLVSSPGECLCWGGAYTPEEAVQSWIDSKPHRENLLEKEPRLSKMAVGLFYYEEWDSFYWVYWYMF